MTRLVQDKPIYLRKRLVGTLKASRTFVTHRNKEHFFRKYKGFGISAEVIKELKKYDCEIVKIVYTKIDNTQEIYIAPLNKFLESGVFYKNGLNDYQRILNINEFNKVV
jgi:anaerobic glycerol-3-phosphate dehydrogenase